MPKGVYIHSKKGPLERIIAKVNKDGPLWNGTPCWIWTGAKDKLGYGRVFIHIGKTRFVHSIVYQYLVGPLPPNTELDHLCANPSCCNPVHIEPKTHAVHMNKNRRDQCIHGHIRTPENTLVLPNGKRKCRICHREQAKARYQAIHRR